MIFTRSDLCRVLSTITFLEQLRRLMIHPLESVELVIWGNPRGNKNPRQYHHLSQAQIIPGRSMADVGKYMEIRPSQAHDLVLDRVTHHGVDLNGSEVPLSSQLAHQHGRHRRGQDVVKDLVLKEPPCRGEVGAPGPKIPRG